MLERGKFLGSVRNLTAAAAIIPFSFSSGQVYHEQTGSGYTRVEAASQNQQENDSFLGQFDKYLETDYGKAIAGSLFVFAIANSIYRYKKGLEQDSDRKRLESRSSSALLILLSLDFLAQTQTNVDPKITCAVLNAFTVLNSAYAIESTLEQDRDFWGKRFPSFVASASLIALSSLISLDTFDKS